MKDRWRKQHLNRRWSVYTWARQALPEDPEITAIWYWICLLSGAHRGLSGFSKSFNNYAMWRVRVRVKSPNSLQFYWNCRKTCMQSFTECRYIYALYPFTAESLYHFGMLFLYPIMCLTCCKKLRDVFFSLYHTSFFFPVHQWKLPVAPTSLVAKRVSHEPFHNGKVAGKGSCDVRENEEPRKLNKMHVKIDITVSCKISILPSTYILFHLITICL